MICETTNFNFPLLVCFALLIARYSHLMVLDFSDSMPIMPPDNLQDFIVDQRDGGVDHHQQQFPRNVPENDMLRDVTDRSPIAVLFESILPWMNYGTREHDDLPEQEPNQD